MENPTILKLREQVLTLPLSKSGKRMGITLDLRMAILSAQRSSEFSGETFCRAIGISYSVFAKWKREFEKKPQPRKGIGFQKVKISSEEAGSFQGKYILEGPRGLRVIAGSASDVANIWRALC